MMIRLSSCALLLVSSVSFADKASIEAYVTKQCQDAKDSVGKHAGPCDEEIKAFAAVDCTDNAQRKTIAPVTLELACKNKVKGGGKAEGEKKAEASVPCKAVDDKGEVLAETTAEAAYKCNAALKPMLLGKCPPKTAIWKYTLVSTIGGQEKKLPGTVACGSK